MIPDVARILCCCHKKSQQNESDDAENDEAGGSDRSWLEIPWRLARHGVLVGVAINPETSETEVSLEERTWFPSQR